MAERGLATLTERLEIEYSDAPLALEGDRYKKLAVSNSSICKIGGGVKLEYNLRDYNGTHLIPSNHTVSTQTNCTIFRLDSHRYWRDYDGSSQSFGGMFYKSHGWFPHGRCYKDFH